EPLQAAEMVLIRIAHAAELPSPDDLIRLLGTGAGAARTSGQAATATPQNGIRMQAAPPMEVPRGTHAPSRPAPPTEAAADATRGPRSFAEVVELAGAHRDARLKVHLEEHVRLVRFEPGRLEINLVEGSPHGLANEIAERLRKWTGSRWVVAVTREAGEPPIGEVRRR